MNTAQMSSYAAAAVDAYATHRPCCKAQAEQAAVENGAADDEQTTLWAALYLVSGDIPCTCH